MTVLRFFGVAFLCVFYSMSLVAQEWVTAEPAVRGIKITGFTRAQAKMPLISEVSGKVVSVYADVGEPIPQSGLFACLDDVFVKIDIQSAQNAISRHYGDIKYFKKEVERHKKLVRKQTSAVTVLDNLERKLNEARHLAAIESLRKKRLQELKKRHCIKAPPGWLVTKRDIEPGQWVNEGQVLGEAGNYQQLSVPLTEGEYDLAGFSVGIVEKANIIDGSRVQAGDKLIGIASSGPHSNGYSLIRKILDTRGISLNDDFQGKKLAEVLLTPTRIYVKSLLKLLESVPVHAFSHITGGGITENLPRVLPGTLAAEIDLSSWTMPDIFGWLCMRLIKAEDVLQAVSNLSMMEKENQ